MAVTLRRITANNFRKFRAPVTIEGLTDGLNIVVEPNETGKSTLLEAIRAAFFVPHRSSNQLTRSYQPFGENVAPEVEVSFDVAGVPWTVTKRFLKSPSMEVGNRTFEAVALRHPERFDEAVSAAAKARLQAANIAPSEYLIP